MIAEKSVILTTGIYDLIKDQIRRRKVNLEFENRLIQELRMAKQVLRKDLPADIVNVNQKVTIKNHTDNTTNEYLFVDTNKAKPKKNKIAVSDPIALSTLGRKVGDKFLWPFDGEDKEIEILDVQPIVQ